MFSHSKRAYHDHWHHDLPQHPDFLDSDQTTFTLNKDSKTDSWTYLKNKLRVYDSEFISGLREELDSDLIFAGLFSAVVTAFLMESYHFLGPPGDQPVVDVLKDILLQLQSNGNSSDAISSASNLSSGVESTAPRVYNILWFIALATSLFVALFCILMKQFLREYLRWTEAHGQDAIRIRQLRREEFAVWSIKDKIIVILPSMLQVSVILFVVGLIFFLLEVDYITAVSVAILVVIYSWAFVYSLLIPVFVEKSPYRTQLVIYVRNMAHMLRVTWEVLQKMFQRRISWTEAAEGVSFLGRFDWVYRDKIRSWSYTSESSYDPLNTAFGWIRSQFPDERTYDRILDCLSHFHSLPFVLDGGRRLRYGRQTIQDVLKYWTRAPSPGETFDPSLLIYGLEAVYLNARAPGEFPSLVPPVEVLPGLTEFIIYRQDYMLSDEQVISLTRLFYDLHSYHYDHLGLGTSLPKENDLAYRRILRFLLEPRPSWIKPPADAFQKILDYGSGLHRNLSLDGTTTAPIFRAHSTAALIFQISLLSMDEHLQNEKLVGAFRKLCRNVSQFFIASQGVPDDWGSNFRPELRRHIVEFNRRYPQFSLQLQPVIDHLQRCNLLTNASTGESEGSLMEQTFTATADTAV